MKIEGQAIVNQDGVFLRNAKTFHQECLKMTKGQEAILKLTVEDEEEFKTIPQLGYLHNEIGVKALHGYQAWGLNIRTREQAVDKLKFDVGFTDPIKDKDGNVVAEIPKRLSSSRIKEMAWFIDKAIIFIQVEMGLEVETPEDYFKRKALKGHG